MKRLFSLFLSLLMLSSLLVLFTGPAKAIEDPVVENVDGAYIYNFENDRIIYKNNAEARIYPTSTVKLMTGILAIEALGDRLDEKITITEAMLSKVSGNNIQLKVGEIVTVRDMIWTLLVNGDNDSAYVIAYTVSGNEQDFITKMNTRAKELGTHNTNYTNPTGIHDDNMYTTVADTALIARHAYSLDLFMECSSSVKYVMPATNSSIQRTIYNRNFLLTVNYDSNYYNAKAKGMNAGSTTQGGYSVVTTAKDGDLTYLVVVMGGKKIDSSIYSYITASKLIDWAFKAYTYSEVLSPNQIICEIPVTLSSVTDYVNLVSFDSLKVYLPSDVDVASQIKLSWVTYSDALQAPVKKDQVVGSVTAIYNDQVLGTSNLIATADVSRSEILYTFYKIEQFTKSRFFIATIIAAVFFTLLYIFGTAFLRGRKNRRMRF